MATDKQLLDLALDRMTEQHMQIQTLQRRLEEMERQAHISEVQSLAMTDRIQEQALQIDEYESTLESLFEAIEDGSLAAEITARAMAGFDICFDKHCQQQSRIQELEAELEEANKQLVNATNIFIELGILEVA
ncbi:hypothetical protein D9M69_385260 [compost metagenome]